MSTVKNVLTRILVGLSRAWRFWMDDIQRRRGCVGKGLSISIGIMVLVCACTVPISILNNTGRAIGVLPTLTPTPAPTATPIPTATRVPTETPIPTQTPAPTSTPTDTPTITPSATTDPAIQEATTTARQQAIATARAVSAFPCQPGQIKGNANSDIYHAPGQRDYEKTQENVVCFDSEEAAQQAGYRKAKQ